MQESAMNLDRRDLKILEILQTEGRITKAELAARINLSTTACWERLKRLEKAGIISGYRAEIAPERISVVSQFLVQIELEHHRAIDFQRFETAVRRIPEIIECVAVGGGADYFLRIVTTNIQEYQQLIDALLDREIGVRRYFTFVVTKAVKSAPTPVDILLSTADKT